MEKSRIIKFRAWNKQKNVMCYEDEDNSAMYLDGWCASDIQVINQTFESKFVKKTYEFMQYTGLHDENGKEIYEGDIIEFSYDMFVGNFNTFVAKGKVIFEEGAFYVEIFENERTTEGEAYLLYSINLDTIEVIGNIYENKELLNETDK